MQILQTNKTSTRMKISNKQAPTHVLTRNRYSQSTIICSICL